MQPLDKVILTLELQTLYLIKYAIWSSNSAPTICWIIYLCFLPNWSTYATGFFKFSTIPGKLFSLLVDTTFSTECRSTYKMFVLAGKDSKLQQINKVSLFKPIHFFSFLLRLPMNWYQTQNLHWKLLLKCWHHECIIEAFQTNN